MNPYTGEVWVDGPEGERTALRFTWRAIGALRARYGRDWQSRCHAILVESDVGELPHLLEAASGVPAEKWIEASPPVVPTTEAVSRAITVAYFGPGALKELEEVEEPARPRRAPLLRTLWRRVFGHGSAPGGASLSSGS